MAGLAVPISSRKIVPPSASMNLPVLSPTAPVNEPATWPNSSLSSSVFGQRAAGHFDKRLVAAAAAAVNGPGDHRFAGAAFAGDQHAGSGIGHAVDHVEHAAHAIIMADDALQAEAHIELRLEILVLFDARGDDCRARSIDISSSSSTSGLVTRSKAPARIASMAVSTVP